MLNVVFFFKSIHPNDRKMKLMTQRGRLGFRIGGDGGGGGHAVRCNSSGTKQLLWGEKKTRAELVTTINMI